MITYQIDLQNGGGVQLIKDDNPKAARPFDGGSIYHAPESYPAKICSFHYGRPTYADDDPHEYGVPVSYPSEMLDYQETVVANEDEWRAAARAYVRGERFT